MSSLSDSAAVRRPGTVSAVQAAAHSLREEVLERLLHSESSGELLGSEQEVLSWLGVSRPTALQAIRLLEAEDLIEVRRGQRGGVWSRVPSPDGVLHSAAVYLRIKKTRLIDLSEVAVSIAPSCMAGAAQHEDVALRCELLSIVHEMQRVKDPAGGRQLARLRNQYFGHVAALTPNPVLSLYFGIVNALTASVRQPLQLSSARRRRSIRFYREAAESVAAGNPEEARRLTTIFFAEQQTWIMSEANKHEPEWLAI
ncbi:MAG: putative transcriptional regulator (GntR-family) [Acidimicrobiales bacterium]|nr:putative transcriptional regulator (GntR-family) [Acidimicrobiales bacterium]